VDTPARGQHAAQLPRADDAGPWRMSRLTRIRFCQARPRFCADRNASSAIPYFDVVVGKNRRGEQGLHSWRPRRRWRKVGHGHPARHLRDGEQRVQGRSRFWLVLVPRAPGPRSLGRRVIPGKVCLPPPAPAIMMALRRALAPPMRALFEQEVRACDGAETDP